MISYLSNGSITIQDTDMVSPYDRTAIMNSIMDIREREQKAQQESMHKTSRY